MKPSRFIKNTRKDLRVVLPEGMTQAFSNAKQRTERELNVALRDNEFAARVLVQAIKDMK